MFPEERNGIMINSLNDFKEKTKQDPFGCCGFFTDGLTIYSVPPNDFMIENFIREMGEGTLYYHVNLDDRDLRDFNGNRIPSVVETLN